MVQLAIKNHVAFATEVSSFFLLHGYELDTIQMKPSQTKESSNEKSSKSQTDVIMSKMKDVMKFA